MFVAFLTEITNFKFKFYFNCCEFVFGDFEKKKKAFKRWKLKTLVYKVCSTFNITNNCTKILSKKEINVRIILTTEIP